MIENIEELILLLLYLTAWKDEVTEDVKVLRSWKGYPFEVLDALQEKGYISQGKYKSRSKSVILTEDGIRQAEQLKKRYLGEEK
jgi:lysophospholipase L1-like esterase